MTKWERAIESFSHMTDEQLRFLIDLKMRQASEIQSEAAILKRVLKHRGKKIGH